MVEPSEPRRARIGAPGLVVDERYRLDELLGAGGFGEVWRATQQVEGEAVRPVALKLMRASDGLSVGTPADANSKGTSNSDSDLSPSNGAQQWLDEVRAVRELRCDAVTTVYDVGVAREPRVAFIAMELLHGCTLAERLDQGPIYWRRALAIARDIGTALVACQKVHVSHCDLKPQNIFLAEGGRVCVVDFGIAALGSGDESDRAGQRAIAAAQLAPDEMLATGAVSLEDLPNAPLAGGSCRVIGTPGYIAPECYAGESPGADADVYALGVVMYQMLTGDLPYRLPEDIAVPTGDGFIGDAASGDSRISNKLIGRYRAAVSSATTRGELVPLRERNPGVPRAVAALIEGLMSFDPAERAADELGERLEDIWYRPHGEPDPPYIGLESFDERRSGFIAGRDADTRAVTEKLRQRRALVLSGPSGCGKSSLAVAGVTARIDQELLDDHDGWHAIVIRPTTGGHELRGVDVDESDGDQQSAHRSPMKVGTVLVVDQLEEVLAIGAETRTEFCAALATLAEGSGSVRVGEQVFGPDDPVKVVATIRDDLFGRVAALPELRRFPEQNLYTVRGVEPNAMDEIVAGPAERAGFSLEHKAQVVAEAAAVLRDDPSALPLVQFALTRWWEERDQAARVLTSAAWQKIGGIQGALAEAAQTLYEGLDVDEREQMRAVMIELFRADGTRIRVPEAELVKSTSAHRLLENRLVRRLVRRHVDSDNQATLEVVHEALGRRWPTLRSWLEETRAERELLQYVRVEAERWHDAERPLEMLWAGDRLAAAQRHVHKAGDAAEFITLSARHMERRRRVRRALMAGAFAALALVVVLLSIGYRDAREARDEAQGARMRVEAANTRLNEEREARAAAVDKFVAQTKELEGSRRALDELETKSAALRRERDAAEKIADSAEASRLRAQLRDAEQRYKQAQRDLQRRRKNANYALEKGFSQSKRKRRLPLNRKSKPNPSPADEDAPPEQQQQSQERTAPSPPAQKSKQ